MSSWNSRGPVLAFFCNWAPYRCYLDLARSERSLPPFVYPIRVMCAGRVDPAMVLYAFEKGAEGVMIIGCEEEECQYGPGPEQTRKTSGPVKGLMHILGLEAERFCTLKYASHERERLLKEIESFAKRISKLGRSPLARSLWNSGGCPPGRRSTKERRGIYSD